MKSNKVITLLKEGFRFETLTKLSESQINTLYGKLISEQSITDAAKKAKEELAGLGQTVDVRYVDMIFVHIIQIQPQNYLEQIIQIQILKIILILLLM